MFNARFAISSPRGKIGANTTHPSLEDQSECIAGCTQAYAESDKTIPVRGRLKLRRKDTREEKRRRNNRGDESDTEIDGTVYKRERDAPGQNCIYIPPGDHEKEVYRLATYSKYPLGVPTKVTDMAAGGFYYTGYKDRVKCFCCGLAVENWMVGDDALEIRWHKQDCDLAKGRSINIPLPTPNFRTLFREYMGKPCQIPMVHSIVQQKNYAAMPRRNVSYETNLPVTSSNHPVDVTDVTAARLQQVRINDTLPVLTIASVLSTEHENFLRGLNLRSEYDRRKTFSKWPCYPAPHLVKSLVENGFFYLGNLDRTQCFSCSGVLRNWAPHDDVKEQHAKHFGHCRIVKEEYSGNISMTPIQRRDAEEAERLRLAEILPSENGPQEPQDPTPEMQMQLAQHYPCNEAVNPHMRSLERRIETFNQQWPKNRIRSTPQQIAKAGFFYLGEGDKTKCFYCNGGLQNWDPNDEPWTEHAKWFPGCEFVIRKKGVEFVSRLADAHPNLNRPTIRNPVKLNIPLMETNKSPTVTFESQMTSIDITQVENMGFNRSLIERLIRSKLSRGGYSNTQELIDDILEHGGEEEPMPMESQQSSTRYTEEHFEAVASVAAASGLKRGGQKVGEQQQEGMTVKKTRTSSPAASFIQEEEGELAESLREIKETSLCRRCKKAKAGVVLIPCGHLAACEACAPLIKRCIICDIKVTSVVKVYRV